MEGDLIFLGTSPVASALGETKPERSRSTSNGSSSGRSTEYRPSAEAEAEPSGTRHEPKHPTFLHPLASLLSLFGVLCLSLSSRAQLASHFTLGHARRRLRFPPLRSPEVSPPPSPAAPPSPPCRFRFSWGFSVRVWPATPSLILACWLQDRLLCVWPVGSPPVGEVLALVLIRLRRVQ